MNSLSTTGSLTEEISYEHPLHTYPKFCRISFYICLNVMYFTRLLVIGDDNYSVELVSIYRIVMKLPLIRPTHLIKPCLPRDTLS